MFRRLSDEQTFRNSKALFFSKLCKSTYKLSKNYSLSDKVWHNYSLSDKVWHNCVDLSHNILASIYEFLVLCHICDLHDVKFYKISS